ncbi:LHFPL tetraspan subfamily member 2b isoform X3 [Hypanus sabinus]|uniref:LHFPL tetraspan subfamily member 2b isoform X3 n=1 Tax=Hypanus sabinus TaxID=79690 RepID=UPI0028C47261|nr:LHFPL tetraspan subfamily member 2b isoform X3 [Hypanus sabinus]
MFGKRPFQNDTGGQFPHLTSILESSGMTQTEENYEDLSHMTDGRLAVGSLMFSKTFSVTCKQTPFSTKERKEVCLLRIMNGIVGRP